MSDTSTRAYWDRRDAEITADVAAARARAASPQGQIDALRTERNALYHDQVESGADARERIDANDLQQD